MMVFNNLASYSSPHPVLDLMRMATRMKDVKSADGGYLSADQDGDYHELGQKYWLLTAGKG